MSPPRPPKSENLMPGSTTLCLRRNSGGSKVISVQSTVQHFIQTAKGKAFPLAIHTVLKIVILSGFRVCNLCTYQSINKLRIFTQGHLSLKLIIENVTRKH